ncbi:MAG: cyclic nucleotide-binding domain-containing protein [Anaerolineae bacterium]|nr:cyclic nucleotide-binding domain-containing protein [Anaerolineae bacterium]
MTTNALLTHDTIQLLHTAFPDLSRNDIEALVQAAQVRTFPANFDIFQEGDEGDSLFLLQEGEVHIVVHADDHQEILVDTLGPTRYFGEMAFLGETSRMATIRTKTECRVIEINETDFMSIARTNPSLLRTLMRQIIGHIRRTDRAVINELNLKNEALQEAYANLEAQEALRSQVIVTLSHELRTPLTSIRGYLGLINQGAMSGNSLKVALASITRNVEKIIGHTNDLLLLYEMHPKATDYEYINVPDILIEALNTARATMEAEAVRVTMDIAPDVPEIFADRRGLVLAIRALLENAFKYSPDKTPVAIRAYRDNGMGVAIAIQDEGIGIAEAEAERIFDAFYRLEKEGATHLFPGLGVGLTIAKFVVDRHHGRITVGSTPGAGSTFTIILPHRAA